ncbi:hypothetical protein AWB70_01036 [Caballeronia cordobensis]|uniref:Uncharacterized protein n=1 Tax=Caballeronia cordobensis TaxID=1353886 RepID=A0A158FL50_CABCO|nr:hypothetical protein [Caballeronia cordobensis]SAL20383.1 hypothetical protein AWB70_01036 [Caballeronia cordobensis]
MNIRKLARDGVLDLFLAACFYLWLVCDVGAARTLVHVYVTLVAVCLWIAAITFKSEDFERFAPVNATYDLISSLAIVLALVWAGEGALATVVFAPYLVVLAKREAKK